MPSTSPENKVTQTRATLLQLLNAIGDRLPRQAPIRDYVTRNTLEGYEHLPFADAITQAHKVRGTMGYESIAQYQKYCAQGRITKADLDAVLLADDTLDAEAIIVQTENVLLSKRDLYFCRLLYPLDAKTACQLRWEIDENHALDKLQSDLPSAVRQQLLVQGLPKKEPVLVQDLWTSCLRVLGLEYFLLHPEELMDLSPAQADAMLGDINAYSEVTDVEQIRVRRRLRRETDVLINALLRRVGSELSLRGLLLALTGEDILECIRPLLVRQLANFLDHGMAAWRESYPTGGFYLTWRVNALHDQAWMIEDMPDWTDNIESLPEDALDVLLSELTRLGLPEDRWGAYLERLALELPGWSGMFYWRCQHQGYANLPAQVAIQDYLAVRLVLERLYAARLCRRVWNIAPQLSVLTWYFHQHREEFMMRYALYNGRLPEYIGSRVHRLVDLSAVTTQREGEWQQLAHVYLTWRHSPAAERPRGHSVYRSAWRLFRLVQHLGMSEPTLSSLTRAQIDTMLDCVENISDERAGYLWLQAFEGHYRDQIFNAVTQNHNLGRWRTRSDRPEAQVIFCMDDREEGIRRHLEIQNPKIETLGAAGFFGVAMNWQGLDDTTTSALCPIAVNPSHRVVEVARSTEKTLSRRHGKGRRLHMFFNQWLFNENRRNLLVTSVSLVVAGFYAGCALLAKVLSPRHSANLVAHMRNLIETPVSTDVRLNAPDDGFTPTPTHNRDGFTDAEQTERVAGLLRVMGLTSGFAPLIALAGHGSVSQNNPHRALYDCGACFGRHGGPNARVYAAMANRPEVRTLLRAVEIIVPEDTWFVGSMHNTADDSLTWYDEHLVPLNALPQVQKLKQDLQIACGRSAQERCRKFVSAPAHVSTARAKTHVKRRSVDFSQALPELGHQTNAAAFIGRRSLSQGLFFDRRTFLISYDPDTDPSGSVLENIMLAVGPVISGINLEYYFSAVDEINSGSGTKIMHNVTGEFGVMEGVESDLRTGLPKQMIALHEPMRLQVLIEARLETLTQIFERQPMVRKLYKNRWMLLAAKVPDSPEIFVYNAKEEWQPWHAASTVAPLDNIPDLPRWYRGVTDPLPPVWVGRGSEVKHA